MMSDKGYRKAENKIINEMAKPKTVVAPVYRKPIKTKHDTQVEFY